MQVQMYSLSGEPNGTTEAITVSKPGQSYTIYSATTISNKAELSESMQYMLKDKSNPDIQDYAKRLLKIKG